MARARPITGDFDECFELGGAVRAGENTIVLKLDGKPVPGYIFLGPKGRWSYPSDDPGLNRLYFDTIEFASRYRMRGIENWLKATRDALASNTNNVSANINEGLKKHL